MAFAQSKVRITSDLLERLDAIAFGRAPVDALAQIEFLAGKLRNVAPADHSMILGLVAGIRRDADAFWGHFERAFEHAGYDPMLVLNAVLSLNEMGQRRDGLKLLKEHASSFRAIEDLQMSISFFGCFGFPSEALKLAELLDRMTGTSTYGSLFRGIDSALSEKGVSENDLFEATEVLRDYLSGLGYLRLSESFMYDSNGRWGGTFVLQVALPEKAERIYEIEKATNSTMLASGAKAIESDAFGWFFSPSLEAPRACIVD